MKGSTRRLKPRGTREVKGSRRSVCPRSRCQRAPFQFGAVTCGHRIQRRFSGLQCLPARQDRRRALTADEIDCRRSLDTSKNIQMTLPAENVETFRIAALLNAFGVSGRDSLTDLGQRELTFAPSQPLLLQTEAKAAS